MDPLSIMGSLVGLIGAAGKVGSVLVAVKKSIIDAPRLMDQVLSQVKELEMSLSAVQNFLVGVSSAPRGRTSMIRVNQLVATLTEAVLTFSELETLATSIAKDNGLPITTRLMHVWKEDAVASIMLRLERHKSSLSLMLNIAQCESDLEAERSRETLQNLIEELLTQNVDISRRLQKIEDNFESRSIVTTCFRNGNMDEPAASESNVEKDPQLEIRQTRPSLRTSYLIADALTEDTSRACFQLDLGTSRVYQRTERYESDLSFTSSAVRTHAWSIFSGLSLSDVSVISVIALPLYLDEISNKEWYMLNKIGHSNLKVASQAMNGSPLFTSVADIASSPASSNPIGPVVPIAPDTDAQAEPPAVPNPARFIESSFQTTIQYRNMVTYKLVVLGDTDVGKTCLTTQFCFQTFYEGFDPTIIEDSYRKLDIIDGNACHIEILDTAGREGYNAFGDQWIRDGEGFVLIYPVTSRSSFNFCRKWFHKIEETKASSSRQPKIASLNPPSYPVILVGNKSDRVTERDVWTHEGYALARELGCEFLEASAKIFVNVERAFHEAVRSLRRNLIHQTIKQQPATRSLSTIGNPRETPIDKTNESRKYRRSKKP